MTKISEEGLEDLKKIYLSCGIPLPDDAQLLEDAMQLLKVTEILLFNNDENE